MPLSNHNYSEYLGNKNDLSFYVDPTAASHITDAASKIKPKNSLDVNNISTKMMKYTINDIATPMSHIINLTFSTGIIPDGMKIAKIIPIFKSGDTFSFNNYRPISTLPAFSKIIEKNMHFKLSNFLNSSKQYHKHQYGFRKGH